MICKNRLNVQGKVVRTTESWDTGALIKVRERKCEKCGEIHLTTEKAQDEIYRLAQIEHEKKEELAKEIFYLNGVKSDYLNIMKLIKIGIDIIE